MTRLDFLLHSPAMEALGWTLVHSLWQGAFMFLILKLLLHWVSPSAANLRYVLIISSMAIMCSWSVGTFWEVYIPLTAAEHGFGMSEMIVLPDTEFGETIFFAPEVEESLTWPQALEGMIQPLRPYVPILVWAWFGGLLFLSIRFTGNLYYLHGMKRRGAFAVSEEWENRLAAFLMRTGITRPVQMLESRRVTSPFTIGFLRPVILLPVGLLTGLPPQEVEAIILHELAHIRRADYLVNLLQSLVEVLFFYHPAVQWMSRQARIEREHCCDDQVMNWRQDPLVYAQALMHLQSFSIHPNSTFAMSFTGNKTSFTQRIHRLFEPQTASVRDKAIMLLMMLSMGFALMAFNLPTSIENAPSFTEAPLAPDDQEVTTIEILPEFTQRDLDLLVERLAEEDIYLTLDYLKYRHDRLVEVKGSLTTDFGQLHFSSDRLEMILLTVNWKTQLMRVMVNPGERGLRFGEEEAPEVELAELDEPFGDEENFFERGNTWEEGDEVDNDFHFEMEELDEEDGGDHEDGTFVFEEDGADEMIFPGDDGEAVPLLIIDGQLYEGLGKAAYTEKIHAISPDDIATINILGDGAAFEIYEVEGYNNVMVINTKKAAKQSNGMSFETRLTFNDNLTNYALIPNQETQTLHIKFKLGVGAHIRMLLLDQENKVAGEIADRYFEKGANNLNWSTIDLPIGKYTLEFHQYKNEE